MAKIIRGARVDEEAWETFKNFVKAKYGKIHGCFGLELEKAMLSWVSAPARARSHTNSRYPNVRMRRSTDTAKAIYHEICRAVPKDHLRVSMQQVHKAIGAVVSHDPRNNRKYMPMLLSLGFIAETKVIGVYAICERVSAGAQRVPEPKLVANARDKLRRPAE